MAFSNNKPHVCFEINKDMDYWAVGEFLTFDSKDTFSNIILETHPKLKDAKNLEDDTKIAFYRDYVNQIYKDREIELINIQNEVQESWDSVEQRFLEKTQKLFNGHPWPEGAYIGFLSIFNCNPRFLDEKTFQVYYKHPEGLVYSCAHEMMHFMLYDYLEKNPELTKNFSESMIWDLSEIFNFIILQTPQFVEITCTPEPYSYKEHENRIPKIRKLMERSKNIDDMIKESFRFLV